MKFGRLNIIVSAIVIFLAAAGGFLLGFSIEDQLEGDVYMMTYARLLLKAGHTHGMPFAMYNMIIGVMVDRLALSDLGKKWLSRLSILSLIMPVGLILRGMTDASMMFAPVVLIGAIFFIASAGVMLKGALGLKE